MFHHIIQHALALYHSRSGATAMEYGLIAALIGLAIAGGAASLGNAISAQFSRESAKVDAY